MGRKIEESWVIFVNMEAPLQAIFEIDIPKEKQNA